MDDLNFARLLARVSRLSHVQAAALLRRCLQRIDELRLSELEIIEPETPLTPPGAGGREGGTGEPSESGDSESEDAPLPPTSGVRVSIKRTTVMHTVLIERAYGVCGGFGIITHTWHGRTDVLVCNCFGDDAGDFDLLRIEVDGEVVLEEHEDCIPPEWCVWGYGFDGEWEEHFNAINKGGAQPGVSLTGLLLTSVGGRIFADEKTGKVGGGQGIYPYQTWARGSAHGASFTFDEMRGRAQRHPMWRLNPESMENGRLVPVIYDEPASLVTASHVSPRLSRFLCRNRSGMRASDHDEKPH